MSDPVVLSHWQAAPLIQARQQSRDLAATSLDLGLSAVQVRLDAGGATLPDGHQIPWETLEQIRAEVTACFAIRDGEAVKIQAFSPELNRFYSLYPTQRAPTLLVSGIPMHRIQGTDPHQDTLQKVRTVAPITDQVLDTCTGLGYTAIEAARTADRVVTIELDPAVLEVARLNPWSRSLFESPRIRQIVGDAFDEVGSFEDSSFSRILHDPPTFSLAGDLYGGEFYRELFRVLKRGGRLFHYIGDLESRLGRNVARGVVSRLQEAGFSRVVRKPAAFGVTAYK